MKKVQLNGISEGVRYPLTTLFAQHIQEAYAEIVDALVKGLIEDPSKLTILNGCVIGGASPNFTVSAGAAYYQGEIFLVDAGTVNVPSGQTLVWRIEESYAAGDPVTFSDNIPRNAHLIRKMKLVAGASGSGVEDNAEAMRLDVLAKIEQLQSDKADVVQEPWKDLVLGSGIITHTSATYGHPIPNAGYMKDTLGFVHLRGVIQATISEPNDWYLVATLPEGYRPSHAVNLSAGDAVQNRVMPTGEIRMSGTAMVLDGITFKAAQ